MGGIGTRRSLPHHLGGNDGEHDDGGPAGTGSDRLRNLSLTQRLLARPAAGALIIVVFVFLIFFAISFSRRGLDAPFLSLAGTLNYLDVAAQVGIIATAVALLMIAGEFDLSIGSMVGFARDHHGHRHHHLEPAGVAVDPDRDGARDASSAPSTGSSSSGPGCRRSS